MDPMSGTANGDGGLDERDLVERQEVAGSAAPELEEILVDGHSSPGRPTSRLGHLSDPKVAPAGGALVSHRRDGADPA